jgi:hypothetical protein
MATCRAIVNGALRKLGKLAAGREARDADRDDALEALRGLYRFLITSGAFGRLKDVVPTGATYTAGENERIFRNDDATLSVTLPEIVRRDCSPRPYDDECACPSGDVATDMRPPRDGAVVVVSDAFTGVTVHYIYDGQLRLWQSIDGLDVDDAAPLSTRDAEGLKALLATRLVDEFGGAIGPATVQLAGMFQANLTTRFSAPREMSHTEYF